MQHLAHQVRATAMAKTYRPHVADYSFGYTSVCRRHIGPNAPVCLVRPDDRQVRLASTPPHEQHTPSTYHKVDDQRDQVVVAAAVPAAGLAVVVAVPAVVVVAAVRAVPEVVATVVEVWASYRCRPHTRSTR